MLKELVEFSRELEKNGIYDKIEEAQQKIDKPIMVIPVKDDLSDIDTENIYFVVKDIDREPDNGEIINRLVFDDRQKSSKRIDAETVFFEIEKVKTIMEEDIVWGNILLNISLYTNKVFGTNKNIDRVGGISSYNILIFSIYPDSDVKNILKKTYHTNQGNLKDYIDIEDKIIRTKLISAIANLGLDKCSEIISRHIETLFVYTACKSCAVIIKVPNEQLILDANNDQKKQDVYRILYNHFLSKKSFAKENKEFYLYRENYVNIVCSNCHSQLKEKDDFLSLPTVFQNLNDSKPFMVHNDRKNCLNLAV
ncbi:hypothetical protein KJ656_15000, partial [bacterium]|nr:hypothetical protein [bacterium]